MVKVRQFCKRQKSGFFSRLSGGARDLGAPAGGILMVLAFFCLVPALAEAKTYASILTNYVDEQGMVDYRGLNDKRFWLDLAVAKLEKQPAAEYAKWNDNQHIAFWLNAYNLLTLRLIVDYYPIKADLISSMTKPANSIKQISGAFSRPRFKVMGQKISLDGIQDIKLRGQFNEPRIHLALVCAARGCPKLRQETYVGDKLNQQLDDQARQFLQNPEKFRIDRQKRVIHLSSIFKWYGKDFKESYAKTDQFKDYKEGQRAVLNFISGYLEPEQKALLDGPKMKFKYMKYDWSLNEQGKK